MAVPRPPNKPKPGQPVRVSIHITYEDAVWVDKQAERLSAGEKFGRRLTRSDVIRSLIRDARTASK
jgi:hypothetical protein